MRLIYALPITYLAGLLLVSSPAYSAHSLDDNWEITGFGTIGFAQTDKYQDRTLRRNVYQDSRKLRDDPFLTDSRFGLQIHGTISDHWEITGQVIARYQIARNPEDYIRFLFMRYRLDNEWQLALGRQPFDLFFLSDHRDVGYSYDWVRPPTELYGFIPYDSFDGIKVTKEWGTFDSSWSWNASIGNIKSKFESGATIEDEQNETTTAKPIYGTEINWQSDTWQVRANMALLKFRQEIDSEENLRQLMESITPFWPDFKRVIGDFVKDTTLRYGAIGASWQDNGWKIQTEFSILDADFVNFNGERAYFHVAHRFQNWLPFVTLGYAHDSNSHTYTPPPLDSGLDTLYEDVQEEVMSFRHNQHSVSVGVRWDFARQKALKTQCDRFFFKENSGSLHVRVDEKYRQNETKTWCSISFDWVF